MFDIKRLARNHTNEERKKTPLNLNELTQQIARIRQHLIQLLLLLFIRDMEIVKKKIIRNFRLTIGSEMPLSKQLRISSVNFDVDDDEDAFVDEVDGEDPDDALCANRKSMCSRRPLPAPPCAAVRNCMRVHIHTHRET